MRSPILRPSLQWRCLLLVLMAIPVAATPEEGAILRNWLLNLTYPPDMFASWRDHNSPDPCNLTNYQRWYGVSCENSNNVLRINIHGAVIGGLLVPELAQLSNLTHLNLDDDIFSGPIPQEFGNLLALTNLSLSANYLNGPIPVSLSKLTKLEYLNLGSNVFSGPIPQEFGNLGALTYLNIRVNNLNGSIPTSLGKLTKLEYLDLYSNYLNGSIPPELGNLSTLTEVYLGDNILSGPIPFTDGRDSKLQFLGLGFNNFRGPYPESLATFPFLYDINLSTNSISGTLYIGRILELLSTTSAPYNVTFDIRSMNLENNSITDVNVAVGNLQKSPKVAFSLLGNPYCDGSIDLYDDLKRCLCQQDNHCYWPNHFNSPSSGSHINSNRMIIGIICGIFFLLAIFVGVLIKCKLSKLKDKRKQSVHGTQGKQIELLSMLSQENMDARFLDALRIISDVKAFDHHSFSTNTHQCMRLVGFYIKVGEFFESARKAYENFPAGETMLSLDATLSVLQKGKVLLSKYTKEDWHTIVMSGGLNQGSFDAIHLELKACIQTIREFLEEKIPEIEFLPFMQLEYLGMPLLLQSNECNEATSLGGDVDKDKIDMLAKVKSTRLQTNNTRSLTEEERSSKILALDIASASLQDEAPTPTITTKIEDLPVVLRINPSHIELRERLGCGGSAEVFKCRWSDVDCAVKILERGDVNGLRAEVGKLMELRHPNIVTLFGFSVGEGDLEGRPMVVMELLNGDLRLLLRDGPLRLSKAVDIIHKIATGMKYLHSRGVFHGDLKSMNVLVKDLTDLFEVKITDFGVSQQIFKYVDHDSANNEINTKTFNGRIGTSMWMAPEVLTSSGDGNMYSAKADVYSFAMVCVEILTGKMPYSKSLEKIKDIRQYVVDEDKRPELPLSLPNDLQELIVQCWDKDPEFRPDFQEICTCLQKLRAHSEALHKRPRKFSLW